MRVVQRLASRLWPQGWHPGGIGWAMARGQLADEVVIVEVGGEPVAWVALGADGPHAVLAVVDPAHAGAAESVAGLLSERGTHFAIEATPESAGLLKALESRGLALCRGEPVLGMRRSAVDEWLELPAGYAVRAVDPERERGARVDVHRAAWRPGSLPFATERPDVDPEATSSFTTSDYDAVRAAWLYDPQLDLVVVAPNGDFAGCCIAWYDAATGVAEIEPMGVVPEHRGHGLAVAMCQAVTARVYAMGGRELFINTGPRSEYPAPGRAYTKAGFETFERAVLYECTSGNH